MNRHLGPKLTGRTRHRVRTDWRGRQTLILQHQMEGFVPEYSGGRVDGGFKSWWVDSKPEWVMQEEQA